MGIQRCDDVIRHIAYQYIRHLHPLLISYDSVLPPGAFAAGERDGGEHEGAGHREGGRVAGVGDEQAERGRAGSVPGVVGQVPQGAGCAEQAHPRDHRTGDASQIMAVMPSDAVSSPGISRPPLACRSPSRPAPQPPAMAQMAWANKPAVATLPASPVARGRNEATTPAATVPRPKPKPRTALATAIMTGGPGVSCIRAGAPIRITPTASSVRYPNLFIKPDAASSAATVPSRSRPVASPAPALPAPAEAAYIGVTD